MNASKALGSYGERVAELYLREKGCVVLDRNWRCPEGEIDIVARQGGVLVVCEVKTRRGDQFGTPEEAVTPAKTRRLRRLATRWIAESGLRPASIRFDVVTVRPGASGAPIVDHLQDAF